MASGAVPFSRSPPISDFSSPPSRNSIKTGCLYFLSAVPPDPSTRWPWPAHPAPVCGNLMGSSRGSSPGTISFTPRQLPGWSSWPKPVPSQVPCSRPCLLSQCLPWSHLEASFKACARTGPLPWCPSCTMWQGCWVGRCPPLGLCVTSALTGPGWPVNRPGSWRAAGRRCNSGIAAGGPAASAEPEHGGCPAHGTPGCLGGEVSGMWVGTSSAVPDCHHTPSEGPERVTSFTLLSTFQFHPSGPHVHSALLRILLCL